MAWEVEYTDEFGDWYRGLTAREPRTIDVAVHVLLAHCPALGRPYVDTIKGSRHANMKELRPRGGNIRILFAFDPQRMAILLIPLCDRDRRQDRPLAGVVRRDDPDCRRSVRRAPDHVEEGRIAMSGHHPWSTIRDRSKDTPEERAEMAEMRRGMEAVIRLEQLRKRRRLSQVEVAGALGINQQTVSKIERSDNPYVETIREYVEGLGGELRLVAVFPDEAVEFTVPSR